MMYLLQRGLYFMILLSALSLTGTSVVSAKKCVLPQQRPGLEQERTVFDTLRHSRRFRLMHSDSLHHALSTLTNLGDGYLRGKGTLDRDSLLEGMLENSELSDLKGWMMQGERTPWEKMPNSGPPESTGKSGRKFFLKKSTPKQRPKPAPETSTGPKIWLLTELSDPR